MANATPRCPTLQRGDLYLFATPFVQFFAASFAVCKTVLSTINGLLPV
jgi:hypothetical protein